MTVSLSVAMAVKDPQSRSPGGRYTPEPEPVPGEDRRTGGYQARTLHFKFLEHYTTTIIDIRNLHEKKYASKNFRRYILERKSELSVNSHENRPKAMQ